MSLRIAFSWRRFVSWRWWVSRYRTQKWVSLSDDELAARGLPTSEDAHGMATFILDSYERDKQPPRV